METLSASRVPFLIVLKLFEESFERYLMLKNFNYIYFHFDTFLMKLMIRFDKTLLFIKFYKN